MLSEISQTVKHKEAMISLICAIYKTKSNKQRKQNRNRLIVTENKPVAARGEGAGGRTR